MRKATLVTACMLLSVLISALPSHAQGEGGHCFRTGGCPWMGGGWKSTPQSSRSRQFRPGAGCPWMGGGWQSAPQQSRQTAQRLLTESEAAALVRSRIEWTRNPNLKLSQITDEGDFFVAVITTQDDSLVDKWKVDKLTGEVASIYPAK